MYYLPFNVQDFQIARGEMNGVNLLQIDICVIIIFYVLIALLYLTQKVLSLI